MIAHVVYDDDGLTVSINFQTYYQNRPDQNLDPIRDFLGPFLRCPNGAEFLKEGFM